MRKILEQFFRFSAVGVMAFLIDYGLLFIFTETLHMHYLCSSILSFTAATAFNYVYSTRYVFQCRSNNDWRGQFLTFLLLSGCGLMLNFILMKLMVEQMALHYMTAKLCAAFLVAVWNFISRKVFLEETILEKCSKKRGKLFQR